MGRKHKANNHSQMDADLIEYLMLADSAVTARTIAQGLGLLRASDVAPRLNALYDSSIISKTKINKSVYWSIEDNSAATASGQVTLTADEKDEITRDSLPLPAAVTGRRIVNAVLRAVLMKILRPCPLLRCPNMRLVRLKPKSAITVAIWSTLCS